MLFRFATFVVVLAAFISQAANAGESQGKLIVKVAVEQTGEPISGARVHANFGIIRADDDQSPLDRKFTDDDGRLELSAPWGHVQLPGPILPVGYWPVTDPALGINQLQRLVITRQQPIAERTFLARKGVVWPMKATTDDGQSISNLEVSIARSADHSHAALVTGARGEGQITTPANGGKISIGFYLRDTELSPLKHAALDIESGFDPTAVREVNVTTGGKREVIDQKGCRAVLESCDVKLRGATAELTFTANRWPEKSPPGELVGTVVDQRGQPVAGAVVRCWAPGVSLEESLQRTDDLGRFRVRGLVRLRSPDEPAGIHLTISKPGFARVLSRHFFKPNEAGVHELTELLALQPGYTLPLIVVDANDRPVEGAWIAEEEGVVSLAKSDAAGYVALEGVPAGSRKFRVSYGDLRVPTTAVVTATTALEPAAVVRLSRDAVPELSRRQAEPLQVGQPAPEWAIDGWSDGQSRTLASLRGRVVVIGFWSLGCVPCRQITLPVENRLRAKMANDVVFVHFHPAGTEPALIQELLSVQKWDLLVGFDRGASAADSETFNRYFARGYPTEVIIDRQGRIAYSPGEHVRDRQQREAAGRAAAEKLGLPWPLNEDADEDEFIRRLQIFHEHFLMTEIAKALTIP
jgi:thiol-disulfide isomerase/thioredoxin